MLVSHRRDHKEHKNTKGLSRPLREFIIRGLNFKQNSVLIVMSTSSQRVPPSRRQLELIKGHVLSRVGLQHQLGGWWKWNFSGSDLSTFSQWDLALILSRDGRVLLAWQEGNLVNWVPEESALNFKSYLRARVIQYHGVLLELGEQPWGSRQLRGVWRSLQRMYGQLYDQRRWDEAERYPRQVWW